MIEDLKGMKETIAYGSSQFRLMKNQETEDYPPHWHTSIEIIMPLENGYQAVIGNECYTLNPLIYQQWGNSFTAGACHR